MLNMFGIDSLEESLLIDKSTSGCQGKITMCCNGKITMSYELGTVITFDLNGLNKVFLTAVPQTLMIKTSVFKVLGAIEFIEGATLGHYKCHFYSNRWFCYDDNDNN